MWPLRFQSNGETKSQNTMKMSKINYIEKEVQSRATKKQKAQFYFTNFVPKNLWPGDVNLETSKVVIPYSIQKPNISIGDKVDFEFYSIKIYEYFVLVFMWYI